MGRRPTWTDDDLRRHLPHATSWRDLRDCLGLVGGGSTTRRLREVCADLGLDTRHLPAPGEFPRGFTDEQLIEAVAASTSLHGVFQHLGLSVGGSAWQRMQDHIVRLGLDTSLGHRRGSTRDVGLRSGPSRSTTSSYDVRCPGHDRSPRS